MWRDQLVEQQDREAPLFLVRLWRRGGHDGRYHRRCCAHRASAAAASASAAPSARAGGHGFFGTPLFLSELRVVGAKAPARPARLGYEVLEQEDVVAQMR